MKNRIWFKGIACLLCTVIMMQTGLFCVKTFADERTISMYYDGFTWKNDYTFTNPVTGEMKTFYAGEDMTRLWYKSLGIPAYCIEPGAHIGYGTTYESGDSNYWYNLGAAKRNGINLALLYGYPNNEFCEQHLLAIALTQIVVWEYVLGYRDPYSGVCTDRSLIDNLSVPDEYQDCYMDYYNILNSLLVQAAIIPSFTSIFFRNAPSCTLKYNATAGDYEATLYDTNSVESLPQISFSAAGVTFEVLDSHTLKITSKTSITSPVSVTGSKKIPMPSQAGAITVWTASDQQSILTGSQIPDPVNTYLNLKTEPTGTLKITKSSEDKIVSGLQFRVTGNGVDKTVTTNSAGTASLTLPVGSYTVAEVNTPARYTQPASQTAAITSGATKALTFTNKLKTGTLKITKTSEDGIVSGMQFRITGNGVAQTVTTGSTGTTSITLPIGTYTVSEVNTPARYTQPASQTAAVTSGATKALTFTNKLKTGTLKITKTSEDKIVSGMQFQISGNGIIKTVTTDRAGTASLTLPIGNYTVSEVNTPSRYVQPARLTATVSAGITSALAFTNKLKTGTLKIIKTSADMIVAWMQFRITGNGIDKTVTADRYGRASLSLPIGTYTVSEINTPARYVQPANQTVVVSYNTTVTAAIKNTLKNGRVKFVKKDSYSGGYLSGAVYRLYKSNGTFVTELTSDASYWVYSPYLPYGSYYLQEVTAPTGFALDSSKYSFSITENEQVIPLTLEDDPLSDVYPEFVTPNASYRDGTEVVVSYFIHNDSYAEHAADRPLTVDLTCYTNMTCTDMQKTVVVPRNSENLVWFKVDIPAGADEINFSCTVEVPDGVEETNINNNVDLQTVAVTSQTDSQTPDTKFENRPGSFNKPSDSAAVPAGDYASNVTPDAEWQQWVYENGAWSKKTYGLTLTADQQITPDVNAFSSFLSDIDSLWHMRSGYGLSLTAKAGVTQYQDTILPGSEAYVLPQNGNAYFPEFGYQFLNAKYRTLQLTAPGTFEFEQNPYSIMANGTHDGRRIHFTPLWYPDGNYTVKTSLYDCWTPAGMISLQSTLKPIVIGGSYYDDWYINHG